MFIALLLAMVASIALPAVIEDSPPETELSTSTKTPVPRPSTIDEPLIAVVDTGVRRSLYDPDLHRSKIEEEGYRVLANYDLVIPYSFPIALDGREAVTVTLDSSFGDNGWADPAKTEHYFGRPRISPDTTYCYKPYNPLSYPFTQIYYYASPTCDAGEIKFEFEAGPRRNIFELRVYRSDTHGEEVAGALLALRKEARLLIQRIRTSGVPHTEDAPSPKEMFDQLRAYNKWAKPGGGEAVRVVSYSYGDAYATLTEAGTVYIDVDDIERPEYAYSVGDFLNENEDALVVFSAGDAKTPFPESQGLIPYWLTGGKVTVSLCLSDGQCSHTHVFDEPESDDYSEVPNRFIAVTGVWDPRTPPTEPLSDEMGAAIAGSRYASCGFAKQWCMAAFAWGEAYHGVPVQAPPGGLPRVVEVTSILPTTITLSAVGASSVTVTGEGGVSVTVASTLQLIPHKFLQYGTGTKYATSRVSAAAAGVMKELDAAGMSDAQLVQAVLFKTAYKCHVFRVGNVMAADPITSMDRAEWLPSSVNCPNDPRERLDDDKVGQGLLNYQGALDDAESMKVSSRDGVLSEFKSTAFNAPEAFGRGAAKRLAEADLELVATATGNTYRHRPPAAGLQPATSAYGDDERIALFGAQRAPPESAGFGLFRHRPAAWAAPEDALASGFTWRSRFAQGALQFSYDRDLLPSRFMAAATLQPEARSSPYLDFVRTGAEASYTRGPLSLAVAQGGRVDELGETEALVALGGYSHALGENAVLHMGLGVLQEDDRLLGAGTGGAFALGEAHTRFARFGVEWRLGKATLFATHWRGETSAPAGETAVFDGPVRARTASYAAGALGEDVLASGDELTFTVYQPLRVYGGRMELSLPTDRNGDEQDGAVALGADGREIGVGLGYRRPLPSGGHWSVGLLHRMDPDHRRGAASESVAAVAVGYDW